MDSYELPDALKPYAQTIEAFGWSRLIPRYDSASSEQQETWRIVIWKADQSIENLMQELGIDRDAAVSLFLDISQPPQNFTWIEFSRSHSGQPRNSPLPHLSQNFTSSSLAVPQVGQTFLAIVSPGEATRAVEPPGRRLSRAPAKSSILK